MEHYETEQQMELHNLDQRMRDAYKDTQRVASKDDAARAGRMRFRAACVLAVLIGLLLAIFL
ncbi:hypothetical protein AB4Z34_22600 [Ensifer sp. 2YAB10]|jgi:conjugal transfer/entry exclusion protein|uniref:hypothetical protein n=1 Tax=Ensifer TaxID=106591 RepID=UPI000DE467D6|nr:MULTISPECIES: hypothetical protein [Ensifer]MBK5570518.1 hypothetical protein [Ensifer sp. SSB1]MBZ7921828.1 hypothetical protein [Ensifer adhaerens]UAX94227.1 hypothetical protein LAC78_08540 [Ensifer adhaerens]UAY01862.1 hypothetical protein LAC80_08550 [Ensifer adhaerens]UAY09245.1 hypothetical protein LAC81_08545 [Ensifer adhaerens]